MSHFNEHSLEMAIMELFEQQGYAYQNGETVHKELSEVLLLDDLRMFLADRYADEGITPLEIERVIAHLTADTGASLYEQNAHVHRLMTEGFTVKREDAALPDLFVVPIDFEHSDRNLFKIVNQLEIKGTEKRIPDGIVYVNGLPVVVLEFKSAVKEETTIMDAFTQLTVRYRRDIPNLFRYNAFVVISDGVNNKYGTLFSPYDFFYAWRKVERSDKATDGISSLHTMMEGLFRMERLLSVVHDFVYFPDNSKKETKIVCRYPQFFATHRLYENILEHSHINIHGDGKGGTYFGATGCGKSLTMLFLTRMLMRSKHLASPTIVLITDRNDLDTQLSELFVNAKRFVGDECVKNVETRKELGEQLRGRKSGGVFLTTIQKFSEDIDLLSDRANIICISDEAHRSQTNVHQNVRVTDTGVRRSYGFAAYLHNSLPNATYVGFTGTPIDATIDVFGEVVDAYTMTESVADDITRRIVYEGRAAKVFADHEKLQEIEEYYKQCAEEGTNEYQIEESKKAVTKMDKILGDPERLAAVARDFVAHYEKRVEEGSTVCGKAMFVCSNRTIAYNLYKQISALRPNWVVSPVQQTEDYALSMAAESMPLYGCDRIKLIMTRNKDDEPTLYDLLGSDEDRKAAALEFKNPNSNFRIAIVVDMWITGFDMPCLDTMYIDKPLQRHTLVQTISRVNRVYEGKDKGLVVDYIGIKNNMNLALKQYADGEGIGLNVETIEQSVAMVKDELDILRRMFDKYDYSKFTTGTPLEQLECLKNAAEFVQTTEKTENLFMGHAKKKSFKELGITYEEKAFYDILKEIARKFGFEYPEDKLLKLSAAVKAMVDDKSKYTDWANRADIKAELKMDLILILAEHGYPPVPQDDVFKEIFEQAENFRKYQVEA